MAVQILYFSSAGLCLFFSLCLIVSEVVLRINASFLLFGVYFLFLSVISLLHALLYAFPASSFSRELLILERVLGLCSGFVVITLIRKMKKDLLGRIQIMAVFSLISVLLVICLTDLFFKLDLLFYTEPFLYVARPLFKIVYIPFSILGLGVIAVLFFRVYRSVTGKYKKVMRTFSFGMFCLLPFEYWDFVNCLVRENILDNAFYVYNAGIFLFAVLIVVFLIQLIRAQLVASGPGAEEPAGKAVPDQERRILNQIYDKIVVNVRSHHLFMDEDLTIENLAQRIHESKIDVSRAINLFYKENFNNFMNYFRVEEMKRLLSDPNQSESIVEMGIRAGFNSKTSVNRVFYRYVRLTPREFRKQVSRGRSGYFSAKIHFPVAKRKQSKIH